MTTNPFLPPSRILIEEPPAGPPEGAFASGQRHWRFLNGLGYVTVVFLALVFSVFREVKHSRELFRMNQFIATSDAQRRQWQDLERLHEAREAHLTAELLRLQGLLHDIRDHPTQP